MGAEILNKKETQKKTKPCIKKQSRSFTISSCVTILILGLVLIFYVSIKLDKPIENKPVTPVITRTYINEVACVDWILKHSLKISKNTAVDIFETAMSIDHGLLLIALAKKESSFNPSAVSKKGAIGLNQIMPNIWAKELIKNKIIKEKRDLFNYKANLRASHYILLKYYKETGSWKKALKKYVGADSKSYVKDVLANCGELYLLSKSE